MFWRIYFVVGDLTATVVAGLAAGWLTWLVVSAAWFMPLAMAFGMVFGTFVGLVIATLLMPAFGGFEILAPSSLSGMMSGMVVGSMESMDPMAAAEAARGGGLIGALCLLATYALQWHLRGEAQ